MTARKLDAAIAESLGYEVDGVFIKRMEGNCMRERQCPRFSTDGNAMLELIKELIHREWEISIEYEIRRDGKMGWRASLWNQKTHTHAEVKFVGELPELISLVAYKALTGKDYA